MFASLENTLLPSLLLVAFLAVIHASFQVATSVLTLLSGHSLIRTHAKHRLTSLNFAYVFGVFAMTFLLVVSTTAAMTLWLPYEFINSVWLALIGASVTIGLLIILFYYRESKGTQLWIPRSFASYLESRAKQTKNAIEAATLGGVSVFAELPFSAVPILTTALVLSSSLMIDDHIIVSMIYSFIVALPLLIITLLLAAGRKLSHIQRWRESNKLFLQFTSGIGLIVSAIFIWVNYILYGGLL